MKKLLLLSAYSLAFLFTGCRNPLPVRPSNAPRDAKSVLQQLADDYIRRSGNTCIVAGALFPDGREVVVHAGRADPENATIPLGEDTLFAIASITKNIVAIAALEAAKAGRVDLDASVLTYAEEPLPEIYRRVTLRDLLYHRSGLPRESLGFLDVPEILDCWFFGGDIYKDASSRAGLYRTLRGTRCVRAVKRAKPEYSNIGFGLLGILLENATGEDIPSLVKRYVTQPFGMKDTTFVPQGTQRDRLAAPTAGDVPKLVRRGHRVPVHQLGDGLRATGGLYSTARDLLCFIRHFLLEKQMLQQFRQQIHEKQDGNLHFNHVLNITPKGHRMLYRWGMFYGYASFVGTDVETGITVVLLRSGTDWPDKLGAIFLETLNDLESRD
ncbi:MAG: beta-lactamase family protein [Kiritimatiellae bacterium]|nr:beta-lactamase family protein [Kiritimatiellia bacterium]